MKTYSKI